MKQVYSKFWDIDIVLKNEGDKKKMRLKNCEDITISQDREETLYSEDGTVVVRYITTVEIIQERIEKNNGI